MLEVVFSENTKGALLLAQAGPGGIIGGPAGQGTALGGRPEDVFCLELRLDVGPLDGDVCGEARAKALRALCACCPEEEQTIAQALRRTGTALAALLRRASTGEDVRLWYSGQPAEQCALCWLTARLSGLPGAGALRLVPLPAWCPGSGNSLVQYRDWGEVAPAAWPSLAAGQRRADETFCRAMRWQWRALAAENAPLRTVLCGRLVSVPEDFYDPLLRAALKSLPPRFDELQLIGDTIGRYQLDLGVGWLSCRVDVLLQAGLLVLDAAAPQAARPHRALQKA